MFTLTGAASVIAAEIRRRGPITFRDFMALALYHPDHGYYMRAAPRLGPEGDFYTNPDLHPAFGVCLGRQLAELWSALDRPSVFDLVELGPGQGLLARDILTWAEDESPEFAAALRYTAVEISPALRARQRQVLARFPADRVRWRETGDIAPGSLIGGVLAHEFFDALPFHRLTVIGGELRELYVDLAADGAGRPAFVERPGPLSTPRLTDYLMGAGVVPIEGARLEVCPEAGEWVRRVGGWLKRGWLLAIDYGQPTAERYAVERQRRGTLATYRRHTQAGDPYQAPGEQDITCQVDFGGLVRRGRQAGMQVQGFTRQSWFLTALGLGDALAARLDDPATTLGDYRTDRRAIEALVRPGGLGDFRALLLGKDVPAGPYLGFRLNDERAALDRL